MNNGSEYKTCRAGRLNGSVRMPGDKSIAHRAMLFGAMADGVSIVEGLPSSADIASTKAALRELGVEIEETGPGVVRVAPGLFLSGRKLDAGNSGTTARLLAGLLAGLRLECVIDGDESLRSRPMERIAEPLRLMGAEIRTAHGGGLPLHIRPGELKGITYRLPVASAQVKSAILIAGLYARGETTVIESRPTRDHTERMLRAMGVPVERSEGDGTVAVTVSGGSRPDGIPISVPGDVSSAAFFLAAASIVPGSEVRLSGTGVNETRTGFIEILKKMGADIHEENRDGSGGEPFADLAVCSSSLGGVRIGGAIIPKLIDEIPILAVVATQANGVTEVRDAGELRHKESDRIMAVVENLTRMGASIEEREDGFLIKGPSPLQGARLSSFGDHRIAMAMAVAGLVADGETVIEGSTVTGISYPDFFRDLNGLISD